MPAKTSKTSKTKALPTGLNYMVHLRLDDNQAEKIKALAAAQKTTRTKILRFIVDQYLG